MISWTAFSGRPRIASCDANVCLSVCKGRTPDRFRGTRLALDGKTYRRCLATKTRGSLLNRLIGVVRPFYDHYAARPRLARTLLRESWFADEPWRSRFGGQGLRVMGHVTALVEQAKVAGELAPATDAQLLSIAFVSFYDFALLGWVQSAIDDPLALFRKLMAQHLHGPTQ
jgi:hypothetical protein